MKKKKTYKSINSNIKFKIKFKKKKKKQINSFS